MRTAKTKAITHQHATYVNRLFWKIIITCRLTLLPQTMISHFLTRLQNEPKSQDRSNLGSTAGYSEPRPGDEHCYHKQHIKKVVGLSSFAVLSRPVWPARDTAIFRDSSAITRRDACVNTRNEERSMGPAETDGCSSHHSLDSPCSLAFSDRDHGIWRDVSLLSWDWRIR